MKYIQLTKGKQAIVDDEDFEYLNQWKWHSDRRSYAVRWQWLGEGKQKKILLHRLVNKTPLGMHTDHINGNPLDDRRANLRTCTQQQNAYNRGMRSDNTSGHTGVSWYERYGKWVVQIGKGGKRKNLGYYSSLDEAISTYQQAAHEYFGEFARE